MDSKKKYLKYKKKYLQLKILKGGTIETINEFIEIAKTKNLKDYQECANILYYFCPDDSEYKNKIKDRSIDVNEMGKLKDAILENFFNTENEYDKYNDVESKLNEIIENYSKKYLPTNPENPVIK